MRDERGDAGSRNILLRQGYGGQARGTRGTRKGAAAKTPGERREDMEER